MLNQWPLEMYSSTYEISFTTNVIWEYRAYCPVTYMRAGVVLDCWFAIFRKEIVKTLFRLSQISSAISMKIVRISYRLRGKMFSQFWGGRKSNHIIEAKMCKKLHCRKIVAGSKTVFFSKWVISSNILVCNFLRMLPFTW